MKIVFFGLGSIGTQHARLIQDHFDCELYAYRTKKGQKNSSLPLQEVETLDDAFSLQPDVAFITNPTHLHAVTALECAKKHIALFIEKPLSHSLEHLDDLKNEIQNNHLVSYVAYNLRFHPVIQYIKDFLSQHEKPFYCKALCSSYLPLWRPDQEYSKTYSASKELGGGVTLDISHEFDYLTWFFGNIQSIKGFCGKLSHLHITSEDIIEAQVTFNTGVRGTVHLDYFSIKKERKLQIYSDEWYVEGNLLENTVTVIDKKGKKQTTHFQSTMDDTYMSQMTYFFQEYKKKNDTMMNNVTEAINMVNKLIEFKRQYCNPG
jgi:predicted dehydrogenase